MASNKIKIGHYNLLQTIGVGSFGKVKLAVHSLTGHKVAMKIVNRRRVATMDMVNRVRREIQYLKLLRHPHIIKLYEVITTPTDVIMVLEYLGSEMFNYIVESGKMPEDSARRFFQQIISAVEYCHRHRIVHRDLKPENLLLDSYNNVKITDFGLSNIMTDGEFLKTSCGSPNYAAPEVISGKFYSGPEVDVWSCGVILYVMLTGRLPFDDENIPNLFKKINAGVFVIPSFVSPGARDILTRMLVVDSLKRATIAEIRAHPWFNINLPVYLRPLPDWREDPLDELDGAIVTELVKKLGFDRDDILSALSEPGNNQIKVSYQLVVDNKRMLDYTHASGCKGIHNFLYGTSPPAWDAALKNPTIRSSSLQEELKYNEVNDPGRSVRRSSISVLSSSLAKSSAVDIPRSGHRRTATLNVPSGPLSLGLLGSSLDSKQFVSAAAAAAAAAVSQTNRSRTRSKWHVGIRSRSLPEEIMVEVYRALKNLGIAWKMIDSHHARCRYVYKDGVVVKFDLQLYATSVNNSYLVDFKHIPLHPQPVRARRTSISKPAISGEGPPLSVSTFRGPVVVVDSEAPTVAGDTANSCSSRRSPLRPPTSHIDEDDGPVTSIFPFFDVCTRLIVELAMV